MARRKAPVLRYTDEDLRIVFLAGRVKGYLDTGMTLDQARYAISDWCDDATWDVIDAFLMDASTEALMEDIRNELSKETE